MKRRLLKLATIAALSLAVGWMTACTPSATPSTQALAPGYQNSADQQMGEILAGAHSFYNSIQQQSQAGTLVLTPAVKLAFNTFGTELNLAQLQYLEYHANPTPASLATVQKSVNEVQSQQAALPLPGAK